MFWVSIDKYLKAFFILRLIKYGISFKKMLIALKKLIQSEVFWNTKVGKIVMKSAILNDVIFPLSALCGHYRDIIA